MSGAVERPARGTRRRRRLPTWLVAGLNVIIAVVIVALLQAFIVKVYSVPSGSMENTLETGDRILVNRLAYTQEGPETGDVVVFEADEVWDVLSATGEESWARKVLTTFGDLTGIGPSSTKALVKRVLGEGGDTVSCCTSGGEVELNGQALVEEYIYGDYPYESGVLDCSTTPRSMRCFGPVEVPESKLLVLGDQRGNSDDSVISCRGQNASAAVSAVEPVECVRWVDEQDVTGQVFTTFWPPSNWRGH